MLEHLITLWAVKGLIARDFFAGNGHHAVALQHQDSAEQIYIWYDKPSYNICDIKHYGAGKDWTLQQVIEWTNK